MENVESKFSVRDNKVSYLVILLQLSLLIVENIMVEIYTNNFVIFLMFDLTRTFVTVDKTLLTSKLKAVGIRGLLTNGLCPSLTIGN